MKAILMEYGRFLIASIAAIVAVTLIPLMRQSYRNYSTEFISAITGVRGDEVQYEDDTKKSPGKKIPDMVAELEGGGTP